MHINATDDDVLICAFGGGGGGCCGCCYRRKRTTRQCLLFLNPFPPVRFAPNDRTRYDHHRQHATLNFAYNFLCTADLQTITQTVKSHPFFMRFSSRRTRERRRAWGVGFCVNATPNQPPKHHSATSALVNLNAPN